MSVLSKLFGKKKKEFKAQCHVSKEPVEKGFGYLLTTAEVVKSKKYWDNIMTDPEMMSYTINHFTKSDNMATQIRKMAFEKYAEKNEPWIVSDSYIGWFDVDQNKAKEEAKKWWESEGQFEPLNSGKAEDVLSENEFGMAREYAIMEAGKSAVNEA